VIVVVIGVGIGIYCYVKHRASPEQAPKTPLIANAGQGQERYPPSYPPAFVDRGLENASIYHQAPPPFVAPHPAANPPPFPPPHPAAYPPPFLPPQPGLNPQPYPGPYAPYPQQHARQYG
jgi:hypothetical protein